MRDIPEGIASDVEFYYTGGNMYKLRRFTTISQVKTIANVTGLDDDSSSEGQASEEMINQYGRNIETISSGLVSTSAHATKLKDDILDKGKQFVNEYEMEVPLNPYLWTNSLVNVNESAISGLGSVLVMARHVSHHYSGNNAQYTRIRGYDA
jgi:hypothetical protein